MQLYKYTFLKNIYFKKIQCVCPGVVDTEFLDRMTGVKGAQKDLNKRIGRVLDSKDIADSVLHVLKAPQHVEVILCFIIFRYRCSLNVIYSFTNRR